MTLLAKIENKIQDGMKKSCNDTFLFLEDESQQIAAEYLLTVNVAKKLSELNQSIGYPYKIHLERKTRQIASDCVPLFGRVVANNFLGYKQVLRKRHNTSRNGKVDIVLYQDFKGLGTPVCVIELKGFNPSRTSVIQDLRRNAEFFQIACRTGESQIQYTCFAALHSFVKSITDEQISADLSSLRTKYEDWQSEVGIPRGVSYKINVTTISKGISLSCADPNSPELAVLEGSHHFAGVVVSYGRKV